MDEVFQLSRDNYEEVVGDLDLTVIPDKTPEEIRQEALEDLMKREARRVVLSKYGDPNVDTTNLSATQELRDRYLPSIRDWIESTHHILRKNNEKRKLVRIIDKIARYVDYDTIALIAWDSIASGVQVLSSINLTETNIILKIAKELEVEAVARKCDAIDPLLYTTLSKKCISNNKLGRWKKLNLIIETVNDFVEFEWEWLSDDEKVQLGHFCKEAVYEASGVFESLYVPLFQGGKVSYKVHIILTEIGEHIRKLLIDRQADTAGQNWAMISPPKPWVINEDGTLKYVGGYYKTRFGQSDALIHGDCGTVVSQAAVDALNRLQSIAWKINPYIHSVLSSMTEGLYDIGSFRGFNDSLFDSMQEVINPEAENIKWDNTGLTDDEIRKRNYAYYLRKKYKTEKDRRKALARNPARVLEMANTFLSCERIYTPWYFDNRTRMYPLCDTLSPQGGDFQKALLEFADGTQANQETEVELLESIATSYGNGFDKKSFHVRAEVGRVLVESMKNHVRTPNTKEAMDVWTEADEPFTFLAMVYEYYKIFIWGIQDTHHVPCGRDATSSGIQLAGALLKDTKTCKLVNVLYDPPKDGANQPPPQDAYGAVALEARKFLEGKIVVIETKDGPQKINWLEKAVAETEKSKKDSYDRRYKKWKKEREKLGDAVEPPKPPIPRSIDDYRQNLPISNVTRSVAKMPVMLKPYGGSFPTINDHVRDKLIDILNPVDKNTGKRKDEDFSFPGEYATVITKALLEGMAVALPAFTKLNKWFQDTAKAIVESNRLDNGKSLTDIVWVTPSGCRVVQGYQKDNLVPTKAVSGSHTKVRSYTMKIMGVEARPDESKMKTAFAANAIHSLDASVIQLAVNQYAAMDNGYGYTAVHDCIFGPAGTLGELTRCIREAFVVVTSSDFLEGFKRENVPPSGNYALFPPTPPKGRANIKLAVNSPYLFS